MKLTENYNFDRLSVNDGLSQNTVYSFTQDRKGFMWICTQQGINKYDGHKFIIYKNNPESEDSIKNDYINISFKDSENKIWFGALDGVFANYNEERNSFNNFQLRTAESISANVSNISAICENTNDDLLISLFGIGLFNFNKENDKFTIVESEEFGTAKDHFSKIISLFRDEQGFTWIGTRDEGLLRIDFKNKTSEKFVHNISDEHSLSNNIIKFIFQDSKKTIWIGTKEGLNRYDPDKNEFRRYFCDSASGNKFNISCISEDKSKNLWIGAFNSGLIKFNADKEIFSVICEEPKNPKALSSNSIISLYSDSSNVLWIGTFIDGINKLDCESKKFYSLKNILHTGQELPNISISSIIKDRDDNLLIGTDIEGLFVINGNEVKNYKLKTDRNLKQNNQTLTCMHADISNDIWIGSHINGLYKFRSDTGEYENYTFSNSNQDCRIHSISKFSNTSDDYLWIGTLTDGLFRFDKRNSEFVKYSTLKSFDRLIAGNGIKCLLLDSEGILWIGTDIGGLNKLDFENGTIIHFLNDKNDIESISDNYIVSICEDLDGNIWVGTMNGGLNYLDKKRNKFKRYNKTGFLPDNTICGIIEDKKGNFWISSNSGLSSLDTGNNIVKNYNVSDGLQSKEFNGGAYYKDKEGVLYFGGINGFIFFKPEEIEDNPYIPEIVLTDFQIFNHSVESSPESPFLKKNIIEAKEINLTYKESVFSFEFASLIYNNPQKNQYAYKMEGFDKDWIYCGTRRFVTYTSLKHGEYIFRVKGSNNDGIWNEKGATLRIFITPPFWKTWWFRSLGLMSVIGTTGLAYHQKLMKVEKEKLLQQDFSRRLLISQENERQKIATELHHTIAHDVLVTKNKISIGLKNTEDPEKVKIILSEISDLASNTLNDVRSISHSLHPHQLESLGLTKAIKSIINNVSKSTEIDFSASLENIDKLFSKEIEINIFRIIQECFNNILKHSKASKAVLNISRNENAIKIIISDNGIGFRKNTDGDEGIGMSETEERLKLYGGKYNIESEKGKGTIISILIPINN